jgi:hypothetical protein
MRSLLSIRLRALTRPHHRTLPGNALLAGSTFVFSMGLAGAAEAYCTLHTCQDVSQAEVDASEDENLEPKQCEREDTCIVEGKELFWDSPCLSFGVSATNTSVLGLTADEFLAIIEDAYKVWEGVECPDGGNPGFKVGSVGVVDVNGNFFCEPEPLANISVWSLVNRWQRDPSALGYTSSTHNKRDGEVFDADVELNLNKIERDHQGSYAIVLGRIAVHEAGHYLGLAHSSDADAVMYESYNAFELLTKELSQDDIEGICELYPPNLKLECSEPGYVEAGLNQAACEEAAAEADEEQEQVSGCSVEPIAGRQQTHWLSIAALLGLVGLVGRRKR